MSFYRKSIWLLKGLREYTRTGYEKASKKFTSSDLEVDCTGKVYLVTGANSGIGKVSAFNFAKRGGTVYLVCRNKERGEEAQRDIIEVTNNNNVHLRILDISNIKEVIKFAKEFCENNERLDVLVNNAGCMLQNFPKTEEGLDTNFATNTLGPFVLTHALLPCLKHSDHGRVIMVSSGGMLVQKLDAKNPQLDGLSKYDGTMVYAQNKRQQIVMTVHFAQQYPEIFFSSMHPGWADTPAVRSAMPDFHRRMKDNLRTDEQGADTVVWLGIADAALKQGNGLFFQDRVPVSTHLPFASTRNSDEEEQMFMDYLNNLSATLGFTVGLHKL
ncbi:DgyrCDS5468 [Dimorphilus gyrociliatus]|uniref:DgyrCDS5468 n=1 Tax=Dimorphilus gyrociliatus TaxID=2664684 RepID=A0A7I8VLL2_9ANNE|nr:DgyrCDS5468 [Dimorphilus gyrociliatus]